MKPILIHVHVFYPELLSEIQLALESFQPYPHELWITYVEGNQEIAKGLSHFERVIPVPNQGYDIGPFIQILNQVDLTKYSYIAKIHTKRNLTKWTFLKHMPVSGSRWRNYLLSYSRPENLAACLDAFDREPSLGMVGHHALIHNTEPGDTNAWEEGKKLLHRCGLEEKNSHFVCGTMFICRAALMQPVKDVLSDVEFETPSRAIRCSISHAVERLLGMCITSQGYEIKDVYTPIKDRKKLKIKGILEYICYNICRFFYLNKTTGSGKRIIKIAKIPVYYSKKAN